MTKQPIRGANLVLLTLSLSLGIFMNVLDSSIANVSIPNIAGDLGVSANQGTWVITSFAVSTGIVLPLTGWLARRFGEVRLFIFSTFLFTVSSVLCGLSENLPMLVAFRILQGAVAGPMIPLSQSILLANYPEDKKGLATALWAMTAVVAPIFGPILGGWITDNYSWPWIFYINVPVGIFTCVVTGILLAGRDTPISKPPIDMVGLVLLIIGIGSLQIMLDHGKDLDWFGSHMIVILACTAVVSLSFLVAWELTEKHPIVDLSLFANRNFTIGTIALSFGYLVFFANIVIFPLWLQTQMGYTPTWAGLAAAPVGILSVLFSPIVGANIHRLDLRVIASFGFIIFAVSSFWSASFNSSVSYEQLIMPRIIQGLGIACFFTPLITMIISGIPHERVASALGLANFFRIVGGSFGTSLSVTLWDRREAFHQSQLVEQVTNFNTTSTELIKQLNHLGFTDFKAYAAVLDIITHQAYMLATNDFFWLSGCIFAGLLVVVWFARPPFMTGGKVVVAE